MIISKDAEVKQQYDFSQTQPFQERPTNIQTLAMVAENTSHTEQSVVKEEPIQKPSKRKKIGHPSKPRIISYETLSQSQATQFGTGSKVQQNSVDESHNILGADPSKPKKKKKKKLKPSDPQQDDLIEVLMYIKKKLPHRSLEKSIIKLYERVQQIEKKRKQNELNNSAVAVSTVVPVQQIMNEMNQNENTEAIIAENKTQMNLDATPTLPQPQSKNFQNNSINFDKVLFPGRKKSVYHDLAGGIAAVSNQVYKNHPSMLTAIETLEKNIDKLSMMGKPRGQSMVDIEFKDEPSQLNKTIMLEASYKFSENQTKKTFISELEREKYEWRRKIATTFIERGYGVTSRIDSQLPPLNLGFSRGKYRTYLGGTMVSTMRKLQSFLAGQLGMVIKFMDMGQAQRLSLLLVNCKVLLSSTEYETFIKFMRIAFGLGDAMVTRTEAINLYVSTMRLLYGKNITMETLQKMGRIQNKRNLQAKLPQLRKYAQILKEKSKVDPGYECDKNVILHQSNLISQKMKESKQNDSDACFDDDFNEQILQMGNGSFEID